MIYSLHLLSDDFYDSNILLFLSRSAQISIYLFEIHDNNIPYKFYTSTQLVIAVNWRDQLSVTMIQLKTHPSI